MHYAFGKKSKSLIRGLHPDLVMVAERAISISKIDFSVVEGMRTLARQNELFKTGASKTMDSRHLTGHAIDVAPYVGGSIRWDWPLFYRLAEVFKLAASQFDIQIVWGGVWDKRLNDLADPEEEVAEYVLRRKSMNRKAFIDGPHFELSREVYK